MPRVSVIMPAFNAATYIGAAIASMLAQTMRDFELIIIEDGSSDGTAALLAQQRDPRIRVVHNGVNRGLIFSRNLGLELAAGEFVAFLDSDDLALPHRLERQLAYLQAHPDLAGIGAWVQPIDQDGRPRPYAWTLPGGPEFVQATFLFRPYITTSAFLARAQVLKQLRFSAEHPLAEDYDLYLRCLERHRLANIPETLVAYRVHADNISRTRRADIIRNMDQISRRQLARLGIEPSARELALHRYIERLDQAPAGQLLPEIRAWLERIRAANERTGIYHQAALRQAIAERWLAVCHAGAAAGLGIVPAYLAGPRGLGPGAEWQRQARLLAKAALHTLHPGRQLHGVNR